MMVVFVEAANQDPSLHERFWEVSALLAVG